MSTVVVEQVKKYKISVFGESYLLVSDEPEGHILAAANLVDNCMREITQKSQITHPGKISVLVAIQLASKMLALKNELENNNQEAAKLIKKLDQLIDYELEQLKPISACSVTD